MKFTLAISIDNDAMQTGRDISDALKQVAAKIHSHDMESDYGNAVMDANGNKVGEWGLDDEWIAGGAL